jgi:hypothetical protein
MRGEAKLHKSTKISHMTASSSSFSTHLSLLHTIITHQLSIMDPRPRRRRPPSNRKHKQPEAPATPKETTKRHSYDLISLLSMAQRCKFRSLPLAWNLAPDTGQGGTSRISQHFIDAPRAFAFKRTTVLFRKVMIRRLMRR